MPTLVKAPNDVCRSPRCYTALSVYREKDRKSPTGYTQYCSACLAKQHAHERRIALAQWRREA